jgi:hypothetical protein
MTGRFGARLLFWYVSCDHAAGKARGNLRWGEGMSEAARDEEKAPWHLWVVGILSLLWNGAGAFVIWSAQAGRWRLSADEAAYYAAQPLWLVLSTDVALASAIGAAIGLLLRRQWAVWLFEVSLVLILVNNIYEIVAGTSRALVNQGAMIVTIVIAILAVAQLMYAAPMQRRDVLR